MLDSKRWLRVVQEAADLLHLGPGDDVTWAVFESILVIRKAVAPFAATRSINRGVHRPRGRAQIRGASGAIRNARRVDG